MWQLKIPIPALLLLLVLLISCNEKKQPSPAEHAQPFAGNYVFKPYSGELPPNDEQMSKRPPLLPFYLLEWEYDDIKSDSLAGKLILHQDFEMPSQDSGPQMINSVSPEGVLYCVISYPDGEQSIYSTEIAAGAISNVIDVPISKPIPWRLDSPALYDFRLLFKTPKGLYENQYYFGFNRPTFKGKYFNFEGQSLFLRGAFDPDAKNLPEGSQQDFNKQLKLKGFNLYIANTPSQETEFFDYQLLASEEGIMFAEISDIQNRAGVLEISGLQAHQERRLLELPSRIGICESRKEILDQVFSGETWDPDKYFSFSTVSPRGTWKTINIPACAQVYEEAISDLDKGLISPVENSGDSAFPQPVCLAYYGVHNSNCTPANPDLYELINLIRRQDWCAGFIIPLDLYTDDIKALMTDDFLIFDHPGFPLERPLKLKAGSTFHLPLRYANLKPEGDAGGVVYWLWKETGEEGRVEYPEPETKGVIEFPALDIPVPGRAGKYTLHFEVHGWDFKANAINWLDVVVE